MAPSQLKQLKASLRDKGITGPQKSKKQKKVDKKDASKRVQRHAALQGIREQFNPFEVKAPARRDKFDMASNRVAKKTIERPGVTRGLGEERRRQTLLKEIQSRNKVGGLLDRRFGEDDPNMTPEQKAAERFAQQALRSSRKNNMFNLEDDSDEEIQLTHGGRALDLNDPSDSAAVNTRDDFDEDLSDSDADDFDAQDDRPRKRVRTQGESGQDGDVDEDDDGSDLPERKRTKNEVMQEVIAKSKAYKAARQAQKEDDDELRAELNEGMGDLFASLLKTGKPNKHQLPSPPTTDSEPVLDPGRAALLAGKSRDEADKEYEANVRQLKLEAKSKPSMKTKTEEQKAAEEKDRLEDLERKRVRRMKGELQDSDEESDHDDSPDWDDKDDADPDDAEAFGLDQPAPRYMPNLAVEEEDEFVLDDIIASDSEADLASDQDDQDNDTDDENSSMQDLEDDGDDDFINGLVLPQQPRLATNTTTATTATTTPSTKSTGLPFTFPCPQSLDELNTCMAAVADENLPTVVQRIRALYHKGLAEGNNDKLAHFSELLLPWIATLVDQTGPHKPSMLIIEQLLRHLHSMAKAYPLSVAASFREYLRKFLQDDDSNNLTVGDLIVLTAVSTIFPTSDQWHSVVTPAMLVLARYLAQAPMLTLSDVAKGSYACCLALRYQHRAQRYVPEVIDFTVKAIQLLAPSGSVGSAPSCTCPSLQHDSEYRLAKKAKKSPVNQLDFNALRDSSTATSHPPSLDPESLLWAQLNVIDLCLDHYLSKTAFAEIVSPVHSLISELASSPSGKNLLHDITRQKLKVLQDRLESVVTSFTASRKPLFLHNHRPLAIKSSYPLFDDQYNPTRKQRDPDAERAELNKLKAEHKKERKGAMRELRKDANFMAREQLREKKARDEAYDKKFKRLVAEIQGEEGREAKEYEREKAKRKGRF